MAALQNWQTDEELVWKSLCQSEQAETNETTHGMMQSSLYILEILLSIREQNCLMRKGGDLQQVCLSLNWVHLSLKGSLLRCFCQV